MVRAGRHELLTAPDVPPAAALDAWAAMQIAAGRVGSREAGRHVVEPFDALVDAMFAGQAPRVRALPRKTALRACRIVLDVWGLV